MCKQPLSTRALQYWDQQILLHMRSWLFLLWLQNRYASKPLFNALNIECVTFPGNLDLKGKKHLHHIGYLMITAPAAHFHQRLSLMWANGPHFWACGINWRSMLRLMFPRNKSLSFTIIPSYYCFYISSFLNPFPIAANPWSIASVYQLMPWIKCAFVSAGMPAGQGTTQ